MNTNPGRGKAGRQMDERLTRAFRSLDGLSVGDAFGQCFFTRSDLVEQLIAERALPSPPWYYTDDTQTALSIVAVLRRFGKIDQDALAESLARHYDYQRSYGPAMHNLLARIREGVSWRDAAPEMFDGQGSCGNGAAMRVAPLGAYLADDLGAVVEQARLSAEVTHAHPEGVAGAVAVAVAAAWAWRLRDCAPRPDFAQFLDLVIESVPDGEVLTGLKRARDMRSVNSIAYPVAVLGNGSRMTAQDTVPFALWCAGQHLDDFKEAMWLTVAGLGDRDTTCAVVGGIVSLSDKRGVPDAWLADRESLDLPGFDVSSALSARGRPSRPRAEREKRGN